MTCREAEPLLSALVDGELEAERAAAVGGHLRDCAECRRERDELAEMVRRARALGPMEPPPALWERIEARLEEGAGGRTGALGPMEPPPALWGRIDARLDAPAAVRGGWPARLVEWMRARGARRPGAPATKWWAAGVTGALAVGAMLAVGALRTPPGGSVSDDALWRQAESELQKAESHYLRAVSDLRRYSERERVSWPEGRRRDFDAALAALDEAAERCRRAARGSPSDPEAQELLRRAYRQEISFLEESLLRRGAQGWGGRR